MQGLLSQEEESSFRVKATNLNSSSGWLDELTGKDFQVSGADIIASMHGTIVSPRIEISSQIEAISFPQLADPMSGEFNLSYIGGEGFTINQFQLATGHEQRITLAKDLVIEPRRGLMRKGSVTLPSDASPTFGAPSNQVIWWLRFRGDMRTELQHYHPRGERIINAFVRGVNALRNASGPRHHVAGSTSTNTGVAPSRATTPAVAKKEKAGTITSSPG